jgi:endo-1,4-beta-D-glucanase Y
MLRKLPTLCAGLLVLVGAFFIAGCNLPSMPTAGTSPALEADRMIVGYSTGLPFFSPEARDYGNSSSLTDKYNQWKSYHVTNSGANGYLRISRDETTFYDTVSEGIGYGMLLAVYFNDQNTFDNIYRYCKYHFLKDDYGNTIPLMHWKINQYGQNVSEFDDYLLDSSVFYINGKRVTSNSTVIPHGPVYGNLSTGKVFILPYANNQNTSAIKAALDNNSNYYPMCADRRGWSSATDADEDIAAALCFASKTWFGGSIDYAGEATQVINAIQQYQFTADGVVKGGNSWGGLDTWNPCYFTPAYYKNIFAVHCPGSASFWNMAYDRMYQEMNLVKTRILQMNGYNTASVFFPDWCSTVGGNLSKATASDRRYYAYGSSSDPRPSNAAPGDHLDARWKDGTSKYDYTANMLSYNSYYDACRVPWRIALDYAWGGNKAWDIQTVLNQTYRNYDAFMARKDGCSITGGPWNYNDRDGWNRGGGGVNPPTVFRFMSACSQMVSNVASDSRYWTDVAKCGIFQGRYSYYQNTLHLLSLLFLTGKFQNLYNPKIADGRTHTWMYRYYNPYVNDHFYTIDFSEIGNGKYGYSLELKGMFAVKKTSVVDGKTTSLFRLYSPSSGDHFYTISWAEANSACNYCGYVYEGIEGNVYPKQYNGTIPIYRYWNGGLGDHFYTSDYNELGGGRIGYGYEGVAFYAERL